MLKISYFHTNNHAETSVPLFTCVIDDTDGSRWGGLDGIEALFVRIFLQCFDTVSWLI